MIEGIRKRPGMYVGGTGGKNILHLLMEVVANSMDQYLAGRCSRIGIAIDADGTITVEDDGPGFPASGTPRLPPLDRLLTTRSIRATVDGHAPHVHMDLGGIGLCVVNALSEAYELSTVHDGREGRIASSRGRSTTGLSVTPTDRPSGTRVRFRADREIFQAARIPMVALAERLEDLAITCPGLRLDCTVSSTADTGGGRAWIAENLRGSVPPVATHRGRFTTPAGPVDVDVALAWEDRSHAEPVIRSLVNLGRSRGHGTHVDGMIDGIRRFVGADRRDVVRGLVATVGVVLADVHFGSPTRDQLVTPEVRAVVAQATRVALEAWDQANPGALAALRAAKPPRPKRRPKRKPKPTRPRRS